MENSILSNLNSTGALYRVRGILQCILKNSINDSERIAIEKMLDDSVIVAGRKVSSYAQAALQIFNIKNIDKDYEEAIELAENLPEACKHMKSL